ncbi:MAG: ribonuclease PH [Planctomycetia bacterium]|jgi:ribonuclease PH|nr:ribonuclease PH [Planctomycetia bacterium]
MPRADGRAPDQLRPVKITRGFCDATPGSVLYESGRTRVFVTASIEERVPPWMQGRGQGWLTAEYSMLPGSTPDRKARASSTNRVDGRTYEIQRLVGRALRSVLDPQALGERTIWVDCDVLQADGGTRTASINGAYLAVVDALKKHKFSRPLARWPLKEPVGAVSVGIAAGKALLDLDYSEDKDAAVDMNVVMTASGKFIEVQGTGESRPFEGDELAAMLSLASKGIETILARAKAELAG